MIEEIAIVTRTGNGRVWLKSSQNDACGGCVQKASCGTAALAKLLPTRELEIDNRLGLQAGDRVRVAIDDAHLLSGSALLYLLPLLMMLGSVGLANAILPAATAAAWMPEIALSGLLLAFRTIHHLQKRLLRRVVTPIISPCQRVAEGVPKSFDV
ncbi:MAG: SoxR reducing system RseC family protein [Gammaproteobacteria bacterium]